jgi:hypothetical protein
MLAQIHAPALMGFGSAEVPHVVVPLQLKVQAPMGMSVRSGCKGWPSQLPFKKILSGRNAVV